MKIGVFDSGLGGLNIALHMRCAMPHYDYVFLGDTLNVPYGKRAQETIYNLTLKAVEYLFAHKDCQIVIVACNTASAAALRQIQQSWLPFSPFAARRVLGVVVPMIEEVCQLQTDKAGLIGTDYIIHSGVYEQELKKKNADITLITQATPLLVPLLEDNGHKYIQTILDDYMAPLLAQNIEALILGCTHYALLKPYLRYLSPSLKIISPDDIIPLKCEEYLVRHPEQEASLSQNGTMDFYLTDMGASYLNKMAYLSGENFNFEKVSY